MATLIVLVACLEETPKPVWMEPDEPTQPPRGLPVRVTTPSPEPADTGEPAEPAPYLCPDPGEIPDRACGVDLEGTTPEARATDVDVDEPVSFWLTAEDPAARATMDGVPGTSANRGRRVDFLPEAPLAPDSPYVARLCACGVESFVTFTTGIALGTPVADVAALAGRTWSVDLAAGRYLAPSGLDTLLGGSMQGRLLLEVVASGDTLELRQAWSDPAAIAGTTAQDACSPTVDAEVDFGTNPSFTMGPSDGWFPNVAPTRVEGATLSGTFSSDGTRIADVVWDGLVDTAPWGEELTSHDPAAFCALLPPLGAACEPCADATPNCLHIRIDSLQGVEVSPLALTPVTAACPP